MEATELLKTVIGVAASITTILLGLTAFALYRFRKAVWAEEKRRAAARFHAQKESGEPDKRAYA